MNARMAGFWGTAFNSRGNVSDYPIIEFQGAITSGSYPNGGVAGFYGWNNTTAAWDPIGLPAGFSYNTWVQLTVTLGPGKTFQYTVSDGLHNVSIASPFSDNNDASLGYVALEGYNYGNDYSIFWDNLSAVFKR